MLRQPQLLLLLLRYGQQQSSLVQLQLLPADLQL
jgi:hypothetical protein